jgi:hypothetical protein
MATLTATKVTLADGRKLINGYEVRLRKVDMERCDFKEGDQLDIVYKKGEVRIKKK